MRINKKKVNKNLPMTLAPKFQFGGFPSIFSQDIDFSDYNNVRNTLTGDPTVGDTFERAFSEDNPDLIGRRFMSDLSFDIAQNQNPLLTEYDPVFAGLTLDQAAEDAAKRRTFLGIGKGRARRKAEEQLREGLAQKNQEITQTNQTNSVDVLSNLTQGNEQANLLLNLLSNFQFQQGGRLALGPMAGGQERRVPPDQGLGLQYVDAERSGEQIIPLDQSGLSKFFMDMATLDHPYEKKSRKLIEVLGRGKSYNLSQGEEDALRHAGTAMYMTSGQGPLAAPLKGAYTNLLGLAHELH
ncbi:MAG TPA: hypothetical protein VGK47_11545, partial [Nitrososphaeraceae archaeon]